MYILKDEFEWDLAKAQSNLIKHGVSFAEAASVFADLDALDEADLVHSELEPRRFRLGFSSAGNLLIVFYTSREGENGKTKNRIISARKANRKERRAYSD